MHTRLPRFFLRLLATTALLLGAVQPAFAIRPKDELVLPTPPVEVLRGNSVVSAHVVRRGEALQACLASAGRALQVEVHARIRWDRRGRARSIVLRGGSAEFRRCATDALRGRLPIVRRHAGSGRVVFVVHQPISPDPLAIQ